MLTLSGILTPVRAAIAAAGAPAGSAAVSALVAHSRRRASRPHSQANASGLASKPPVRAARLSHDLDVCILGGDRERIEATITSLCNGMPGHHDPLHDAVPNSERLSRQAKPWPERPVSPY